MKTILPAAAAALVCLCLDACSTMDSTTSSAASSSVGAEAQTLATNIYTAICVGSGGNPPLTAAVDALTGSGAVSLNADQSALYGVIKTDCGYGAPTTAVAVLLWTATLYATIEKQFPQVVIKL